MDNRSDVENKLISYFALSEWLFSVIALLITFIFQVISFFNHDGKNQLIFMLLPELVTTKISAPLGHVMAVIYLTSCLYLYYRTVIGMYTFTYLSDICTFQVILVNNKITQLIRNCQRIENDLEYSSNEDFQEEMFKTLKMISENIWNYNR